MNAPQPHTQLGGLHRIAWLDTAKGAMILLVVFGHDWRGLSRSGIVPENLFHHIDNRIYAFHMPVFFALSGYFFLASLEKFSVLEFSKRRIIRLLWPMVMWTYIFLGLKVLAGPATNSPITLDGFWISPIPGTLHLWFLWALIVLNFCFLPLKLFIRNGKVSKLVILVIGSVIVSLQYLGISGEMAEWVGPAVQNAPYFFLGVVLGQYAGQYEVTARGRIVALIGFMVLLAAWPEIKGSGFGLIGSLTLTFCVISFFSSLSNSRTTKVLTQLGLASMAIYLAHTIFSAATREVLFSLGISDLTTHVILGTLIGVVGPFIIFVIAKRTQTSRFFCF
jgi:fucose 4-O-acetylase-like acetyltransferase